MISKELKKILNLVKKTGAPVVLYNTQESDDTFVLMDFNSYEKLVEEKAGPIENNNSLVVKKELELKEKEGNLLVKDQPGDLEPKGLTEEDLTDKINQEISLWKNQENQSFVADDNKEEKSIKPWSISSKVKQKAKEVE